ncbi:lactonase family protein [Pirellulales bacterium]|nr:lactonase family protein [Pirellulales bacterium]
MKSGYNRGFQESCLFILARVGVLLPNCFMSEITHYIMCLQKHGFFPTTRRTLSSIFLFILFCWPTGFVHADHFVWFGTYTGKTPRGNGIYVSRYNEITGEISQPKLATKVKNPSFLAVHPTLPVVYGVSEIADLNDKPTGGIISFIVDMHSGQLTQQSVQPSQGKGPCHLSVDATGKSLLAANYGSGSVICLGITDDGSLLPPVATKQDKPGGFIQHVGTGPNKSRQRAPHGHSMNATTTGKFAISCDLGADKVFVHKLDVSAAVITPHNSASTQPGGGPRHFALHPRLPFGYTNNELDMTVTAFHFDAAEGRLQKIHSVSTIPDSVHERTGFSTAEIAIHPSGKFLYVSNRGHDSIALFGINEQSGKLSLKSVEPTRCQTPRHFAIAPGGERLYAAGQASGTITAFTINSETGKLSFTKRILKVPKPVCIVFSHPISSTPKKP